MKKIIVIMVFLCLADIATAEQFELFSGMTTSGEGQAIRLVKSLKYWTCQVNYTGNPDNLSVSLMGSLDGTYFQDILNITQNVMKDGRFFTIITPAPTRNIKGKIVSIVGGVAPKVTMICEGME
ncbi:MAG: hypothetical protein HQK96_19570 [Nitrospirae bacterium]|nr:hypothetical protein [Nitrospirota bacterium]